MISVVNTLFKVLGGSYNDYDIDRFDKVDSGLIRYFRTEYGSDWQAALDHYLFKESIKNRKKAA